MNLDEYKRVVSERYMALPEEEKAMLTELSNTPVGYVLGKLLGPEMGDVVAQSNNPQPARDLDMQTRQGLGAAI